MQGGISFYRSLIFFGQDLSWTFKIEGDKRAMLTTGQENTSPPPPLSRELLRKLEIPVDLLRLSRSPLLLLPPCDRRDGEGLGCEECWWTRQGNRVRSCLLHHMKLSCLLLDTAGDSHWSGLAAEAVIGGFGRWQGPRRGRGALRREGTNTEASTDDYPTTQCPVVR